MGGVHLCSHERLSGIGHPAPPASLQVQLRLPHPFPTKHIHTITLVSSHTKISHLYSVVE